jgi:Lon protease-like protein
MSALLPLFPLNLVVFPDEELNLHVFEPRYRQLVNEVLETEGTFGVPAFIGNRVENYGTRMQIMSVKTHYKDGRMDIETRGLQVFRLLSFSNPAPGKLYAGGQPEDLKLDDDYEPLVKEKLAGELYCLYDILQTELEIEWEARFFSYHIGHKVGLSIEQEYELLQLETERARQQYLLDHLQKTIPVVAEMERTKERIRMNGHFKRLDPLNF